ncbi:MAG: histidine phosphatase family protein [Lachnospiraceae bacterium]|nr:histidine phosphatase family protein [Lachnospiraceae bacterium]
MRLIFIRHGETAWSPEGRYQGISDTALSPAGIEKLRPAGPLLRARLPGLAEPEFVCVSGLLRTRQTADILFPGVPQIVLPGLREMDFGVFEGKNYRELEENPSYRAWVEGGCLGTCPGGESKAGFCVRVLRTFEELMECFAGEKTLILVVHGGTIMALLERFGQPERPYFDWHLPCGHAYLLKASDWRKEKILRLEGSLDFTGEAWGGRQQGWI